MPPVDVSCLQVSALISPSHREFFLGKGSTQEWHSIPLWFVAIWSSRKASHVPWGIGLQTDHGCSLTEFLTPSFMLKFGRID